MTDPADVRADEDAFRAAVGRLPAGVAVVTVVRRGIAHATTVNSVVSVSLDPPLLLFCVHADSRLRDVLDEVDTWAVSVLGDDQADVADWLASPGRPAVGQLDRVPHVPAPVSGAPWLEGAAAWFDCRTSALHPAGDHDVVVGDVLAVAQGAPAAGGLVHLRGRVRPVR
ncbi:flavin reductase [Cellulomonas sp. JZ18]|uniref:flavin reductase family protein n=1 Tax=Cellulomonas sp. JZ18 TaxID=2654191 RepID=UPI0012D40901|nr:flavin reductase family protein [Cellulomonas sp. JZ18]QGQ20078.1 flavin reductase [Cellulomonas sp. JZ18]